MESKTEEHLIILYLDKTGQVFIDTQPISWDNIYECLSEKYGKNLHKGIEVYADKEVYFELIARIMEIAGYLNIGNVNFIL